MIIKVDTDSFQRMGIVDTVIYEYLKEHEDSSCKEIADMMQMTPNGIRSVLKRLADDGLIRVLTLYPDKTRSMIIGVEVLKCDEVLEDWKKENE